jgi:hypothetical protein
METALLLISVVILLVLQVAFVKGIDLDESKQTCASGLKAVKTNKLAIRLAIGISSLLQIIELILLEV